MSQLTQLARQQRKNHNPWEEKVWYYLRNHRMCGIQFRRQVPFENKYIADFCSHQKKIIIELDGGQHSEDNISLHDKDKENYFINKNYKVLRFWNIDIDTNLEGVLETIRKAVQ